MIIRSIAMMSANHIDRDLGAEIYVLDGPPGPDPGLRRHDHLVSEHATDR